MATPLGQLLRELRIDAGLQARFRSSPTDYLLDHGWEDLEPADLQEALLLLADAAPPTDAVEWIAAGASIDTNAHDTAGALTSALGTFDGQDLMSHDDPDHLDDPAGHSDPADLDEMPPDDDPADLDTIDDLSETHPTVAADSPVDRSPDTTLDTTTSSDAPDTATTETFVSDVDGPTDIFDESIGMEPIDDAPFADDTVEPSETITDPEPDWDDPSAS